MANMEMQAPAVDRDATGERKDGRGLVDRIRKFGQTIGLVSRAKMPDRATVTRASGDLSVSPDAAPASRLAGRTPATPAAPRRETVADAVIGRMLADQQKQHADMRGRLRVLDADAPKRTAPISTRELREALGNGDLVLGSTRARPAGARTAPRDDGRLPGPAGASQKHRQATLDRLEGRIAPKAVALPGIAESPTAERVDTGTRRLTPFPGKTIANPAELERRVPRRAALHQAAPSAPVAAKSHWSDYTASTASISSRESLDSRTSRSSISSISSTTSVESDTMGAGPTDQTRTATTGKMVRPALVDIPGTRTAPGSRSATDAGGRSAGGAPEKPGNRESLSELVLSERGYDRRPISRGR